jgi:hypothetical protein
MMMPFICSSPVQVASRDRLKQQPVVMKPRKAPSGPPRQTLAKSMRTRDTKVTLAFPNKSEWPTLTDADWVSNRCHAFLKFKRLLMSMFTALHFVVGNENYGGEWALIYDTATRKAHKTFPPPTSAPRKRVHRHTQLFLHRILLDIFSDHCPAIISDYLETSKYDNEALQDDAGHPNCVETV